MLQPQIPKGEAPSVDPLSIMLGEIKAIQVQTLDTVKDMHSRLLQIERAGSEHSARITSIENFVKQHQDADNREKPTVLSAAPIFISTVAVVTTLVVGTLSLVLN